MTCKAVADLMRSCNACPPKGISAPDLYLVDQINAQRATLGGNISVDLTGAPDRDLMGRHMHVRGMWLFVEVNYTTLATNAAVLARTLRSLYQSLRLTDVTGHVYLNDLDGRDLLDDQYFRFNARMIWPYGQAGDQVVTGATIPSGPDITNDYGLASNIGAGVQRRGVGLYIPFTTPHFDPIAGLIPVAALKAQGGSACTFTLRSTVAGNPAGVTVTDVRNTLGQIGIDVYLDLVPLDAIVDGGAWYLDSYTLQGATGRLRHETDSTEYAMVRFRTDDAFGGTIDATYGGEAQADNIDNINVMIAGGPTPLRGWDKRRASARGHFHAFSDRGSALAQNNATGVLPLLSGTGTNLVQMLQPYRPEGYGAVAGQIDYSFGSIGSLTQIRILQRGRVCTSADRLEALAAAADCQITAAIAAPAKGEATTRSPVIMQVRGQ